MDANIPVLCACTRWWIDGVPRATRAPTLLIIVPQPNAQEPSSNARTIDSATQGGSRTPCRDADRAFRFPAFCFLLAAGAAGATLGSGR